MQAIATLAETGALRAHIEATFPLDQAANGSGALKYFVATTRQQFPQAAFELRRVISDGDLVLLHSRNVLVPGTPGMAVFTSSASRTGVVKVLTGGSGRAADLMRVSQP